MTRSVQQLRGTGAQVLVLGPIPDPQSRVPTCLSQHLDDATTCSPPRSEAVNEPGIAAETAAVKAGGGHYADVTPLFCTAERCPPIIGNTLAYFDRGHRLSNMPSYWHRYSAHWPTARWSAVEILPTADDQPAGHLPAGSFHSHVRSAASGRRAEIRCRRRTVAPTGWVRCRRR